MFPLAGLAGTAVASRVDSPLSALTGGRTAAGPRPASSPIDATA